ncbi:MAG: nitroreductase family protein [Bacteroidales bacterium]|jgi:nitroreductase|nr:nitroreductase family protein [Bacteroidales bacterium]
MFDKNSFLNLVKKRQSDRGYLDKSVETEIIERCIEAARLAPSASNGQPWKFIVVDEPDIKNKIADATSNRVIGINHFTKQAPVHIVIVKESANFNSNFGATFKRKDFPLIDIGIAAEHICLQATSEGLGTCILGWFHEKTVKQILNIPKNKRVLLIITLGYPKNEETRKKIRKDSSETVSYNKY